MSHRAHQLVINSAIVYDSHLSRPSTEHPGWQDNCFGDQYGHGGEKAPKCCHLSWGRKLIILMHPAELSWNPLIFSQEQEFTWPVMRSSWGGQMRWSSCKKSWFCKDKLGILRRQTLHIHLCLCWFIPGRRGFCQEHKAHFNPVEASLLFTTFNNDNNNNNNSKLTAHTELFVVTVMSMKGPKFIRNRWGRWCEFNKHQREWERCRHVEWLTGVSLH